jgi:hypothetical protein
MGNGEWDHKLEQIKAKLVKVEEVIDTIIKQIEDLQKEIRRESKKYLKKK